MLLTDQCCSAGLTLLCVLGVICLGEGLQCFAAKDGGGVLTEHLGVCFRAESEIERAREELVPPGLFNASRVAVQNSVGFLDFQALLLAQTLQIVNNVCWCGAEQASLAACAHGRQSSANNLEMNRRANPQPPSDSLFRFAHPDSLWL